MLLQLAVGPMCLLVFNRSAAHGLLTGMTLVAAITLADMLYILLSALGVSALMEKESVQLPVRIIGALVLVLFGLNMVCGALGVSILPDISLFPQDNRQGFFLRGLLLTLSNPLTIIFWSGVFTTQIIDNHYNRIQLRWFGAGCVLATVFFLSLIAILGTLISGFLSESAMKLLNIFVGCFIIYSGIKLLFKRKAKQ
ncbi:MAG: LysE family transporter [Eubacteriales bacterium]|nr:LysE family transporter [Eubacteriales bacterium]